MTVLSVELHAHSAASHDGRDPVELLLKQARAVGLDAIAITDHDTIDASLDAVEKAPAYGLLGIPGVEITTAAGHVLALGVTELIPSGLPFAETLTAIHDQGGIAVVPHPFQESRSGVSKHISKDEIATADAIETYNSRLLFGWRNRQAKRFAQDYDLPITAGSDAHISEMVGQARTNVEVTEPTVDEILAAIVAGRTSIEGSRTPWRISFRQAAGGIKRRLQHRLGQ